MKYTQVDLSRWHQLDQCIAITVHNPEVLEEKCGLKFADDRDDLGELKVALIESESGKQFGLIRHLVSPPGTDILVHSLSQDITADLKEFLDILPLKPADLSWVNPDIDLEKL